MKMRKTLCIALVIALVLSLSPAAYAQSGGADENTLHIKTKAQLIKFAENCSLDTYSEGLTVELDADIDFGDDDFAPIPTFSGVFHGNNHTIRNLSLSTNGSHQGFFRYVQEGGYVEDLHLEGSMKPSSSRSRVGGITGSNYGTIESCSVKGAVEGLTDIGGIAGENFGRIENCSFEGAVIGKSHAGGIAGYNEGTILSCSNKGSVNTVLVTEGIDIDNLTIQKLISADDNDVSMDMGGIAGFSSGKIENCTNSGNVGYQHYGYNVGGIAGRHDGYIADCTNSGEINGRKDVGGIAGQFEPWLELKGQATLADEINNLYWVTVNALNNMSGNADAVVAGLYNAAVAAGGAIGQTSLDPEAGTMDLNALRNYISGIFDNFSTVAAGLDNVSDGLARDLANVSAAFASVMTHLASAAGGATEVVNYDDRSETDDENNKDGKIFNCVNTGNVDGDTDIGGIVGTMGVELEFNLEGNVSKVLTAEQIAVADYLTKCIVRNCVNSGNVCSKKNCAGGIAGLAEMGMVRECEGYGSAKAGGSYAGGVLGYSYTAIRNCWSICRVEAAEYAGGIAGYATKLTQCTDMSNIDPSIPCSGAVAGYMDLHDPEVEMEDNVFVSRSLGAVDGISYSGRAVPVTYEELTASADEKNPLPEQFTDLKLTFVADGKTVRTVSFSYGESIPQSRIPVVPNKTGYIGSCPEYDFSAVYFSDTIEAEYVTKHSTIASDEKREGAKQSLFLAEGSFGDRSSLSVESYDGEGPSVENGSVAEMYTLTIERSNRGFEYTVRYMLPQAQKGYKYELYILKGDGSWEKQDYRSSGSYAIFDIKGNSVTLAAVSVKKTGNFFSNLFS
jgi:hypothetical protein